MSFNFQKGELILIDKELEWTSFDVVNKLRSSIKRKLKIKALPGNLPDSIDVDISSLELGDKYYTSQVDDEDFEILHPDNTVICQVRTSRASMALPEDQEGVEGGEGVEGEEGTEAAEGAESKGSDAEASKGSDAEASKDESKES